ncbi:S-layer homology domain-containing protein, partial [Megasphaera sp.]|uniref:S-layer homology domain-containing protein n=1 Tax=Megasphaera sp. TaxID=2023260 RepID=UPI00257D2FC3
NKQHYEKYYQENDDALCSNDIKEVTLIEGENSATIGLMRNGGKAVDGAITVTSGGGTGGSGAANDTYVKISNGTTERNFATGSKVEAIVDNGATTGIKINGQDYTIKSGSSIDTDTKYTVGNGIAIDENNGNAISVKLKEVENNLKVTEAGLELKKDLTVDSVTAGATTVNSTGVTIGTGDKGIVLSNSNVSMGGRQIHNVDAGEADTDAVNVAQLKKVSEAAASASQGWKLKTQNGNASDVKPGATVEFDGDANIQVGNDGNKVSVTLKNQLTGIQSITGAGEGAGSISFANDGIKFNNKVTIDNTGKISGVADGKISTDSTDAVNGSQLNAVATEAGKHTTLSNGKNTTVESTVKDGQTDYKVNVAGDLTDITSVANGDSKINLNKDSIIISNGNKYFAITNSGIGMSYIGADYSAKSIMLGENGTTISGGLNVAGSKITGVAAGVADTDAVNVGQLNAAVQAGNTDTHIKAGEYGVGADNKVNMDVVDKNGNKVDTVTIKDVAKASDVGNVNNIADDIKNGEGHTTVVDAVNNLNNKVGDLQYSKVEKGDIADGDSTTTAIGKLDQKLTDVAATAAKHTKVEGGNNITVTNTAQEGEAANYKVELKKDIDVDTVKATTVTTGQTVMNNDGLKVGKDVSVTATAVTAGQTSISNDGLKVNGKTYVSDSGLNANDLKITNVADGKVEKGSTDAVNGGQLYNETRVAKDGNFVKKSNTAGENLSALDNQVTANTESIYHMNGRISDLDNRVNKVGAGAAALAALHPLDFDPDAKWDFAAGYGNYRGANAAAVGAYYRPNEDTMFSVGGTFGNGENMVNAGVSFKLGSGSSHVSTSRVAMAKEIKELRGELEAMKSAMLDANAGKKIDTSKLQLFPDVPQNHWAYEYVAQLAGNGMIEGYPDGNFAGDRPMTRYEFAAILYRAMTKGAVLSDKILSEFSHELEYFTVDTIAKDKAGNPTIQRVRTVKENKNK